MAADVDVEIYRIAYISRCIVDMSDLDLVDLERRAADKNKQHHVTGLLLFDGSRFIQALEGSRHATEAIMQRILQDERHDLIDYISRGAAMQRRFGEWSMLCRRVGPDHRDCDFLDTVLSRMLTIQDSALQAAFIGFAKLSGQ